MMYLQSYEFNIGDEVVTTDGIKGKITKICNCDMCQKRGFYEPFWVDEDDKVTRCIDKFTAEIGFLGFYKIGKYRFNDFDKVEVLREMASYEDSLKRLRKQLKIIEEIEWLNSESNN